VHGDLEGADRKSAFAAVWAWVRRIPRGRVMTYGQIANLVEDRLSPRAVGWAMHGCPARVPWHRVVNALGACSTERRPDIPGGLQRAMLEGEGVRFGPDGRLDLTRYRFVPRQSRAARDAGTPTSEGRRPAGRPRARRR